MLGMPYSCHLVISHETYRKLLEMAQGRRTTVEPTAEDIISRAYDEMKAANVADSEHIKYVEKILDARLGIRPEDNLLTPETEYINNVYAGFEKDAKKEVKSDVNAVRNQKKRKPTKRAVADNDSRKKGKPPRNGN